MPMIRTYSHLMELSTFEERFNYTKLEGKVGVDTFGFDRFLNQRFYKSDEWRSLRNKIITRDNGFDLGHPDYNIHGKIIIHHLNPITQKDIVEQSDILLNPDFMICVSLRTHNAIHYGSNNSIDPPIIYRTPNDTCLWKSTNK